MISNCSEFHVHHQKSFRIKHEDTTKFFSKLLSKENTNVAIPSFRIYYGDNVPSSVPFIWESQPGTPKHTLSQTSHYLPPLTPPPSYYKNNDLNKKPTTTKNSRSKLFHALIKKLINPKKPQHIPPSPSSSSSSSMSSSSLSWSGSSHSSLSAPTTPFSKSGGHQAGVFMMKKALFSVLSGRRSS